MNNCIRKRNTNIEFLRILAMMMIISHHYCVHGYDVLGYIPESDTGDFILNIARLGGRIGVSIFVLISGYFLSVQKDFKFEKVIKLWFVVLFYLFAFTILKKIVCPNSEVVLRSLIYQISLFHSHWWFISVYITMYILSPYINIALMSMGQKKHLTLILIFVLIFSFFDWLWFDSIPNYISNELLWFFVLYIIAAYLRYYSSNKMNNINVAILTISIPAMVMILMCAAEAFYNYNILRYNRLQILSNPFVLIFSLGMFLCFKNYNKCDNCLWSKIVLTFSSTAFGVYIIHDHFFMWTHLWRILIGRFPHTTGIDILLNLSASVLGIYLIASVIDLMRIYFIEKPLLPFINSLGVIVQCFFQGIACKINNWYNE